VDIATIIGIVVSFGLMIWAILMGGPLSLFIDTPSIAIVFGGTAGVALISFPLADVLGTIAIFKKTVLIRETDTNALIAQMMEFATKARKGGILSLQDSIDRVEDQFLVKALQMAVDGQEPADLKAMLQTEIDNIAARHGNGAQILDTMGAIAPAMAVALLTTFYGAVLGNVLFIPMAGKLKTRSKTEILQKTVITEGMESILSGENPRIMEQKLHAYIAPRKRESVFNR
jgi:chemotaxis protein MotA